MNKIFKSLPLFLLLFSLFSCGNSVREISNLNDDKKDNISIFDLNLRIDCDKGELSFSNRINKIRDLIIDNYPDIITFQEVQKSQFNMLKSMLGKFYNHSYIFRDSSKNPEGLVTFYKKDYQLDSVDSFWLSETPNVESIGWDAAYLRVCLNTTFITPNGDYLDVFNIHLDNKGEEARVKGLELVLSKVEDNMPSVILGDFNSKIDSSAYELISQKMNDARNSSNEYKDAITYHAYHNGNTSLIDFIFYSNELEINNFKVINDIKNNYSDHYALYSSFIIN